MAIHDPGTLMAECDRCNRTEEFDTTEYAGTPESWGIDDSTLEQSLWSRRSGEVLCPDCGKEEDENDE